MIGEELFLNELNFHIRQGISKKDLTDLINERLKAINYTHSCTELPNKAVKDSQLSDMVEGYKIMCKPDTNFEKYYSKGFTECWEWLKRITK